MSAFFGSPWVALPLTGICVTIVVYLWFDILFGRFLKNTLGNRDEMLKYLDMMHVQADPVRILIIHLLATAGLGAVFFLLLWPHTTLGLIVFVATTIGMWKIPLLYVKRQWEKRCGSFVNQMVDGLTIMANGIKAGLSVTQSMDRVVENMPNPISQEFRLALSQIRIGRSVEEALLDLGERIPKPDVQMFVTAINILKETGGNLAETFQTIVVTIRERQKVEKKIEAMTAQGIMQGLIVSMVPIGLIALFYFIDPGYISPMFTSTLGIILLLVMFVLIIIGGLAIRRVVTIKV